MKTVVEQFPPLKSDTLWAVTVAVSLLFVPGYAFFVFSGLQTGWALLVYDEWRLMQLPFFVLACLLVWHEPQPFVPVQRHASMLIALYAVALLLFFSISIASAEEKTRYLSELFTYFLLFATVLCFAHALRRFPELTEISLTIIALSASATAIWLPIVSLFFLVDRQLFGDWDWHGAFANIRFYDDMLLPCFFVLWHQAGWLKDKRWLVFTVTILYALTIWADGARAILLSISAGLAIAYLFRERRPQNLLIPLAGFGSAFLLYGIWRVVLDFPTRTVARYTSSGRIELWQTAWQAWLEHPVTGVGGNPLGLYPMLSDVYSPLHPHNIVLQWLAEWGLAGLLVVIGCGWLGCMIWRQRQRLSFFAFAGLVALCVNSLLSGALVYPHTQIMYMWFLSWCCSFLILSKEADASVQKNRFWRQGILFACLGCLLGLLVLQGQDYLQVGGTSLSDRDFGNPRFWQFGETVHLRPVSQR